ncbi:MAG TPA: heavy metal-binding domain-containing protein [Polyangiaceae bacterium LLY-WYZ-14_1]|nr:heavy metal-binding domain-containing protein [Polyangiaceae bacterium LLY-WYZ-14_1]
MDVSGLSGNEIYCLAAQGLEPRDITVGNSVYSIGLAGAVGSSLRTLSGGEVEQITSLISEGRHAAIDRMEAEAKREGAHGVTGVVSELRTLSGYTEFLSQGTAVSMRAGVEPPPFFSTAASGIGLYCQLDAGYRPMRFAMGNVAYALGVGRGLVGSLRTLQRGEVTEFSRMYNDIRHVALDRLRREAMSYGATAVVDVRVRLVPSGPGVVELLLTGTASWHPQLQTGQCITSELSGPELWNLAKIGYVPHQLVMGTSVYALGLAGNFGALFKSIQRGEIPELTRIIYEARENCLDLVRKEAEQLGAERVVGNRLSIREISPGLVEVVAIGTAVQRAPSDGFAPAAEQLIPQATLHEIGQTEADDVRTLGVPNVALAARNQVGGQAGGCLVALVVLLFVFGAGCLITLATALGD